MNNETVSKTMYWNNQDNGYYFERSAQSILKPDNDEQRRHLVASSACSSCSCGIGGCGDGGGCDSY